MEGGSPRNHYCLVWTRLWTFTSLSSSHLLLNISVLTNNNHNNNNRLFYKLRWFKVIFISWGRGEPREYYYSDICRLNRDHNHGIVIILTTSTADVAAASFGPGKLCGHLFDLLSSSRGSPIRPIRLVELGLLWGSDRKAVHCTHSNHNHNKR